jgi:hypothetical protein
MYQAWLNPRTACLFVRMRAAAPAAADGTVIMHNLEAALPNNFSGCVGPSSGSSATLTSSGNSSSTASAKRTLGCPGQSGPLYCVGELLVACAASNAQDRFNSHPLLHPTRR